MNTAKTLLPYSVSANVKERITVLIGNNKRKNTARLGGIGTVRGGWKLT